MELRIDPEFKELLPPLLKEEYEGLEKALQEEGCRDPLVVWGDTIIDGHNRYEICKRHGIEFKTTELFFKERDDAKLWMLENQLHKRNLSTQDRITIVERYEDAIKAKAKERQSTSTGGAKPQLREIFPKAEKGRASDVLGAMAGVSGKTYERGVKVLHEALDPIKEATRRDELPIHSAYDTLLMDQDDQQEIASRISTGENAKKVVKDVKEKIRKRQEEDRTPKEPAVPVPAPQEKKDLPPARFVTSEPAPQPQYKCLADNPRTWNAGTRENMEFNRQLLEGNAAMGDPSKTPKYTVHMMLEEMKATFELYMNGIASFYDLHPDMYTKENQAIIEAVYNNYLINKIQEMKERIHYV